jgi:hypothetical protein
VAIFFVDSQGKLELSCPECNKGLEGVQNAQEFYPYELGHEVQTPPV